MGWTCFHSDCYKTTPQGKRVVDVKATCDSLISSAYQVLKSAMVGRYWYAAIARVVDENGVIIPEDQRTVFAECLITSVNNFVYENFGYGGGYQCDDHCPIGILNMLSETSDPQEQAWRERCRENAKAKNNSRLSQLPIGSLILVTRSNGEKLLLEKRSPSHQFKTPWFSEVENAGYYFTKKRIKDFKRVTPLEEPLSKFLSNIKGLYTEDDILKGNYSSEALTNAATTEYGEIYKITVHRIVRNDPYVCIYIVSP